MIACSLLATAMGSSGVAMFLQWVARRPDPSRKRFHAGVFLGAHIHTVALTTVSTLRQICDGALHLFGAGHKFSQVPPHIAHQPQVGALPVHRYRSLRPPFCVIQVHFAASPTLANHFATHPPCVVGSFHRRHAVGFWLSRLRQPTHFPKTHRRDAPTHRASGVTLVCFWERIFTPWRSQR